LSFYVEAEQGQRLKDLPVFTRYVIFIETRGETCYFLIMTPLLLYPPHSGSLGTLKGTRYPMQYIKVWEREEKQ
jgi:hypothetical protein